MEKDLVWEELELDDLLDLGRKSLAAQQLEAEVKKSKAILKQQKLMQKPGFNVLMDRYSSLPSKPKAITMSKLSQLADPIIGRLTHAEKKKYQSVVKRNSGYEELESEDPRVKKIVLSINEEEGDVRFSNLPQPNKIKVASNRDGFFMTEAIPEEDDSVGKTGKQSPQRNRGADSRIQNNISSTKNGFASILRNRIHDAKKISKLAKPLNLYKGRSDDLDESVKREELTNAYKKRLDKLKKANKEIYERNKVTLKKIKDKRDALGLDSSMSESSLKVKVKKAGVIKDPKTGRIKKINGSGYGKLVQRFSNQPKPRALKRTSQSSEENSTNRNPANINDGSVSDITPASTPKKPTFAKKNLTKATSLAAIEEQPREEVTKPLPKKLTSSSAPHLARKSKSKSSLKGNDASTSVNSAVAASQSSQNNNTENAKRRSIRSAGAVRIPREDPETAEMLIRVVEAKRNAVENSDAYNEKETSSSTKKIVSDALTSSGLSGLSPGKSKLEPIQEHSVLSYPVVASSPTLLPATITTSPIKSVAIPISPSKIDEKELKTMENNIQDLLQRDQSKITEDIAASIQKLQQFEKAIVNGDMYCKPDVNSTLVRRAEKLGSHLSAAESILADYEAMKEF